MSTRTEVSAGALVSFAGLALLSVAGVVSLAAARGVSFLTGGVLFAAGFVSATALSACFLSVPAENDPLP